MSKLTVIIAIVLLVITFIPHPISAQDTATSLALITPENASKLKRINALGYGKVVDAEWSTHDDYFIVGVTAGILIYDPQDWTAPPYLIQSKRGRVWRLAVSPTENIVATGNNDGSISLWDFVELEEITVLRGHIMPVMDLEFSHDGTILASTSGYRGGDMAYTSTYEDRIRLWSMTNYTETARYQMETDYSWTTPYKMQFSYDDRYLALVGDKKSFCGHVAEPAGSIIDLQTGIATGERWIYSIDFFASKNWYIQDSGESSSIKIYDAETDATITNLTGIMKEHNAGFIDAVFTSDDRWMITATAFDWYRYQRENLQAGTIWIWDTHTWEIKSIFGENLANAWQISIDHTDTRIATIHEDMSIHIWDIQTERELAHFTGFTDYINSISTSPDNQSVATSSMNGAYVWSMENNNQTLITDDESHAIVFSSDSSSLLFYRDHYANENDYFTRQLEVASWDTATQILSPIKVYTESIGTIYLFQPNGGYFLETEQDARLALYSTTNPQTSISIPLLEDDYISEIGIDEQGQNIVVAGRRVFIWNLDAQESKPLTSNIYPYRDLFNSIEFSRDGQYLAAGGGASPCWNNYDARLVVWDIQTIEPILTSRPGYTDINDVTFSPDSQLLAYASGDGTIHFLETKYWREVGSVVVDTGYAIDIEFTPDGKRLVAGDSGGTIQVFGVEE